MLVWLPVAGQAAHARTRAAHKHSRRPGLTPTTPPPDP